MKFEVVDKDTMNKLSRELSRAGIMNRKYESVDYDIDHYLMIREKYSELLKKSGEIDIIEDTLSNLRQLYDELIEKVQDTMELSIEEFLGDGESERLILLTALIEDKIAEERDGKIVFKKIVPLEDLTIELRFSLDEVEEWLEEIEKRFKTTMTTEVSIVKRYYVEVIEVDRELINLALKIAEEYSTEESYLKAMFTGIARAMLAETVLQTAEKVRKKDKLIESLLEREPIVLENEGEKVYVYFDEESLESFLKELQTLGYLKIKGNRIWV
ncbi:hypothetical protein [Thermococcus gorgonarius]|uniref:Uncharacterized protein n=1 Tax=Thermococcus gorgonarius TaxID=71997 RepID=A0A2Z2M5A4_THEGO|nr:hypothetical protein [Thermococcus gorgonarius]ASJ01330.1 hypothetical protein A3K92_07460 [Thermococcus gorgonarius]